MLSDTDIRRIYQSCRGALLALARKGLPSETDAEDVLHEVFLRFFERASRNMTPHEATRYLMRCVSNAVAEWWRGAGRSSGISEEPVADTPPIPTLVVRREQFDELRAAIAQLPERQKMAISLRYLADKSCEEAADLMDCKPVTVRSLLRHGIERLREILSAETRTNREAEP